MTDIAIWAVSVLAIAGGLWIYQRRIHREKIESAVVSSRHLAKYWPGKIGSEFTQATKMRAYKNAKGKCITCRRMTWLGEPDNRWDTVKGGILGYAEGHADHIIPFTHGGPGELWNCAWLCEVCNSKKSNRITEDTIRLLRKRGEKIYLGEGYEKSNDRKTRSRRATTNACA